jgi:colanic acid biosynthesis glycosyl transferase WcaI
MTDYRRELGVGDETVVMYAGNVGFSQSLELLIAAARALPDVTVVINGDGAARAELQRLANELPNVRFAGYQPKDRLPEVLASADLHVVPLRAGLGNVSVPSKTYSILAAGRPVLAAIDAGTEVPRMLAASGGGRVVAPDQEAEFVGAVREMVADPVALTTMGAAGRAWVEHAASPRAVAEAYEALVLRLSTPNSWRRFGTGYR